MQQAADSICDVQLKFHTIKASCILLVQWS